jgi:hypothetical protein
VLRSVFGPKREEDGLWKILHNNELHGLYSSPNIFRVIKSRRMIWAGYMTRMGEERGIYRFLVGRHKGRDKWGDLGGDGRITLKWTLGR